MLRRLDQWTGVYRCLLTLAGPGIKWGLIPTSYPETPEFPTPCRNPPVDHLA